MSVDSYAYKFFQDKRDKSFIEITSENSFYEIFSIKDKKCPILIPETIVFNNNGMESWFFVKDGHVMMKNTNKLNIKDLFLFLQKRFKKKQSLFYAAVEGQIPILSPENDLDKQKIIVMKMKTDERISVDIFELKKLLDEKQTLISYAQLLVKSSKEKESESDTTETFYCEFKLDPEQATPLIKYYKKYTKNNPTKSDKDVFKSLFAGEKSDKATKVKSGFPRNPNIILEYLTNISNSNQQISSRHKIDITKNIDRIFSCFKTCRLFYKSLDNKLNNRLKEELEKLISYFESCFFVKIRRIVAKFILDSEGLLLFMGATKLCVDGVTLPKQQLSMEEFLIKAEEIAHARNHEKKIKMDELENKISDNQNEGKDPIYSKNLLTRLSMERCSGDLCKYNFLHNIKGVIQYKKFDYIGQKILPFTQKILGSAISDKLPFTLLHKTIINTRNNWEYLIPLLRKNLIVPPNHDKVLKTNSVDDLNDSEYVLEEKHWVDNPYEYYKKVKVCEKCYFIYSFIINSSDLKIQEDLKNQNKKWVHSEQKFLLKIRDIQETSTKRRNIPGSDKKWAKSLHTIPDRTQSPKNKKNNKLEFSPKIRTSTSLNPLKKSESTYLNTAKSMVLTSTEVMNKLKLDPIKETQKPANRSNSKSEIKLSSLLSKEDMGNRLTSENLGKLQRQQSLYPPSSGSSNSVRDIEKAKNRKTTLLESPVSPTKLQRNKSMSTANIILDSTRMNMGLIVSRGNSQNDKRKGAMRLSQVVLRNDDTDIAEDVPSNLSSHRSNPLYFGIVATEEFKNKKIREAKDELEFIPIESGSPTRRSTDALMNPERKKENLDRIHERRKSTKKLLLVSLEKSYEKSPMKLNEFIEKKQRLMRENDNKVIGPISIFHYKTSHLRVHQDYLIHIPKMCMHPPNHRCIMNLEGLDFPKLLLRIKEARKGEIAPFKTESLDDLYNINGVFRKVNVFVYSESTAIPYMVMESKKRDSSEFSQEVLLIINDFFDNFLEKVEYYAKLIRKMYNKKIILFNYPGQAYTVFNKAEIWNNESISCLIDSLLFYLNKINRIDLNYERLKFLGYGYGGNILTYYICSTESASTVLNSALFVNSFSYVDELLFHTLLECISNFENVPEDLPELPFCYYHGLSCTKPLNMDNILKKLKTNPISPSDRVFIIKGCFAGISCKNNIGYIQFPVYSLHSLQNSLVRISHTDINTSIKQDKVATALETMFSEPVAFYKNSSFTPKRSNTYIEGGHDLIEEVPDKLMKIIEEYFLIK